MDDKQNNQNAYLDEPLTPLKNSETVEKKLTPSEQRKQNLKKTFGSGSGLIIITVLVFIVLIFIALIVRTLNNNGVRQQSDNQVETPNTPDNDTTHVPVTLEEAARRQQVANAEALSAAANGASYQPGFDVNRVEQNGQESNGSFDSNGQAKSASNPDNGNQQQGGDGNIQLTPAQQEEMRRIEAERKAQEEARQRQIDAWQKAYEERNSYVEQQKALVAADIAKMLSGTNTKNYSTSVSYLPKNKAKEQQQQNQSNTGTASNTDKKTIIFRTGNSIYAVLDSEVNTDAGNTVIATVYGGQYNGSKLIGNVNKGSGNIELKFTKLAPQDGRESLNIDGIAMRTSDASMAVATSVNKHTISRYASLLFSSALAGLGQAAQQQDSTVTQLNNGSTVTSSTAATDKQIIGYVAGNVGTAISNEIGQGFNRQPTYKISRGTGVAVFMMSDVYSN